MKQIIWICLLLTVGLYSCKEKQIVTHYDSGKVYETYQYKGDTIRHGSYQRYSEEGILVEEATFVEGSYEGIRKIFNEAGYLEIEETYSNKKLNGPYTVYHVNGNPKLKATYTNDVLGGTIFGYYQSGILKEEVTFEDNIENGPFKEYYENGQVMWKGTYKDGDNEFGLLEKFDKNGQLVRKMMCDDRAVCTTTWTIEKEES